MEPQMMSPILESAESGKPFECRTPGLPLESNKGDAVYAGMTLILAQAAAAHLKAQETERAALCVAEAQRCLAHLI